MNTIKNHDKSIVTRGCVLILLGISVISCLVLIQPVIQGSATLVTGIQGGFGARGNTTITIVQELFLYAALIITSLGYFFDRQRHLETFFAFNQQKARIFRYVMVIITLLLMIKFYTNVVNGGYFSSLP